MLETITNINNECDIYDRTDYAWHSPYVYATHTYRNIYLTNDSIWTHLSNTYRCNFKIRSSFTYTWKKSYTYLFYTIETFFTLWNFPKNYSNFTTLTTTLLPQDIMKLIVQQKAFT